MTLRTPVISLIAIALTMLPIASAAQTTHVVNLDGTGDFTSIHDALDAAVAGDTIHLMPGRYTEMREFQFPAFPVPVLAGISLNNITIRGESQDGVIIGPTIPNIVGQGPIGVATDLNTSGIRVESLTIENLFCGVTILGQATLANVTVRGCKSGSTTFSSAVITIENSEFSNNDLGLRLNDPSVESDIGNSVFIENGTGIDVATARGVHIHDCTIIGGGTGIQVEQLGEALIEDCRVEGNSIIALNVTSGSVAICTGSSFIGGQYGVIATGSSDLTIADSLIGGGTDATVLAAGPDRLSVTYCELRNAGGFTVRVGPETPTIDADFTNNYWFTTDISQIEAWIHDGNDDPLINTIIPFEPIFPTPIETESMSWGTLKSTY